MPTSDNQYTAFRCPKDLLELARIKGKKDRRSLSNYLGTLIAKDVEGMVLPEPPKPVKRTKPVQKGRR